jgi:hypothetical protein
MAKLKEPRTKRDKKRLIKKLIIILVTIIVIIGLAFSCFAIGNAIVAKTLPEYSNSFGEVSYSGGEQQLKPVKELDGYWTFTTDEEFKVMQITDIHLGGGLFSASTDKKVLNAIAAMVTAEKPDLVIATGDIAYPVPFSAGTRDNKKAAQAFANLMDGLGVYWTVTFGNHDTESYSKYTREQISEFYSSDQFNYCLFSEGPEEIKGYGNSIIKIKNSKGFVTRAIVTLDSHAYMPSDPMGVKWEYDNIHNNQTEWYKNEMAKLKNANQARFNELSPEEQLPSIKIDVPSSLYFHIALKEYKDAWVKYTDNGSRDIPGVVELEFGRIGETGKLIYHGVGEDNVFDTMVEAGGDSGFCCHDHYNNISIDYWKTEEQVNPIRLTYSLSLDYLAYVGIAGKGAQRGCTIIKYNGADFDITPENYYQDKYKSVAKYKVEEVKIVEEHIPRKKPN